MSNIRLPAIQDESGFYKYLRQINATPSLSQEEEFMLAKKYLEEHDLEAAHTLVTSHLKLVAKIAMRYRNYGLPIAEIVSEGNIGLMQAVKKYDPDLGHRLSTYAMWWIKASIQEYVLKSWSLVKIGTTAAQKKLFFSLNKIKNRISNAQLRPVGVQDYKQIASELGVTTKEVSEMNSRMSQADMSLNQPIGGDDSDREMIETLPEEAPNAELVIMKKQLLNKQKAALSLAMGKLTEREAEILTARKLQDTPLTLNQLSTEYNISMERVRQIENKAFSKVQTYMLSHIDHNGEMASGA